MRVVFGLWVLIFGIGTVSHLADLIGGGLGVYAWAPPVLEPFYLALVGLDALMLVLLTGRRRAGPVLGAVIMMLDVIANWWVTLDGSAPGDLPLVALLPLTLAGGFILITAPRLDRWFRPGSRSGYRAARSWPAR